MPLKLGTPRGLPDSRRGRNAVGMVLEVLVTIKAVGARTRGQCCRETELSLQILETPPRGNDLAIRRTHHGSSLVWMRGGGGARGHLGGYRSIPVQRLSSRWAPAAPSHAGVPCPPIGKQPHRTPQVPGPSDFRPHRPPHRHPKFHGILIDVLRSYLNVPKY